VKSRLIQLQQIGKEYASGEGAVHALRDVDLEVEAGEYVSVLGPSGSGKSTLLHVIGCLDSPSAGRYLLDGTDVGSLDVNRMADVRNRRFGFVFQAFQLMPRLSALDNVALPLRFAGQGIDERRRRAAELLDAVGLADRATHRPTELSGGQQQRVAIARALANRPDVILADEPTGNLDSRAGSEIVELLEQLNANGQTLILVTHDESLAARTRRTIRMLDGAIVSDR
jgi:putative ABC transport system ATP-binding protein